MASIFRRGGSLNLQFTHAGKRKTCSLGGVSRNDAEHVCRQVTQLEQCRTLNVPPSPELTAWLSGITGNLRDCLADVGFCDRTLNLGEYLDRQLERSNTPNRRRVAASLRRLWGELTPVHVISRSDGCRFRDGLRGAENTIRGKVATARSLMRRAVKDGLLAGDPFEGMPTAQKRGKERKVFVSTQEIQLVLDACPDAEFRAIVALGRFAGLRIPSEVDGLRWSDIDWNGRRFVVTDVKRDTLRAVPISPDLLSPLSEAYDAAEEGAEFVLVRHRGESLSRILMRCIRRAGLSVWRKPFHSLRASCSTDWVEEFPIQTVANWLGHSPEVALRHYLQVKESHFNRAAGVDAMAPRSDNHVAIDTEPTCSPGREMSGAL